MTLNNTHNATSSQVSEFGHMHCEKLDGQMTNMSGQGVAHANLSARQAKAMDLLTSGTYGRRSSTLSVNADLTLSLVNKLQAKAGLLGSTLYRLTWKQRTTQQQRLIYALRASVPRISGSASIGWPTPTANSGSGAGTQGRQGGMNIQTAAKLAGWVSPIANDARGSKSSGTGKTRCLKLPGQVAITTPKKTNGYWRDADWLYCTDDKWRPVESGTFPLVNGIAGRVGRLRAYGNAIVAPVAEGFIKAYMDTVAGMQ